MPCYAIQIPGNPGILVVLMWIYEPHQLYTISLKATWDYSYHHLPSWESQRGSSADGSVEVVCFGPLACEEMLQDEAPNLCFLCVEST